MSFNEAAIYASIERKLVTHTCVCGKVTEHASPRRERCDKCSIQVRIERSRKWHAKHSVGRGSKSKT